MNLHRDLKEFLQLLRSHGVEFVVVGAYSFAFHGRPRYTGDLDLFVRRVPANAASLAAAIHEFGFGETGLHAADFLVPDQIIQLGVAPHRIDLLTGITGVSFEEAWATKIEAQLGDVPVFLLSKEMLIRNKLAVGRAQDLADVEELRRSDEP